jgi:hypothetical protein
MSEISHERLIKDARHLLESHFWIPDLKANQPYTRVHDDHDGTFKGNITVLFSVDGDAWCRTLDDHCSRLLRFRNILGGGESLRVRNALMLLAYAIQLDNQENPQTVNK